MFHSEMIMQDVVSSHHMEEVSKDEEKIDKVRALTAFKKGPKSEKLQDLSQRVRSSILKRTRHTRNSST